MAGKSIEYLQCTGEVTSGVQAPVKVEVSYFKTGVLLG